MTVFKSILGLGAAVVLGASCVEVDKSLGESLLPDAQAFKFHNFTVELDDIRMQKADSLSEFSVYRIAFGATNDDLFGVSMHSSAFYLFPVLDTLDFGDEGTQVFKNFHVSAPLDTISCTSPDQAYILQNINVYALTEPMDTKKGVPALSVDKSRRISRGVPVYNGLDSLSFDLNEEYARKYFSITREELDDLGTYLERLPGIYISTDAPSGYGGRVNMFKLPVDVYNSSIRGSCASLSFSAEYNGERKDSVFYFYIGPAEKYNITGVTSTDVSTYPQIALNLTEHSSAALEGAAADVMYFEGGRGIKPVIDASSLREKVASEISAAGGDPSTVIINKASLELPFDFPENYEDMLYYPTTLSPTCRIFNASTGRVSFVGITDNSVSEEDPGTVNRSLCKYSPDITHHLQQLLRLEDMSTVSNYDIWFLAMAQETITTNSSANSEYADYYRQLAYNSYYSQMYGGGYGGYGYSSYYTNYYNYMMMAQMASTSTTTTSTQSMMDANRYYRAALCGPASARRPSVSVVYAIPAED